VGRTLAVSLLALFCLAAALWHTAAYRASRLAGMPSRAAAIHAPTAPADPAAAADPVGAEDLMEMLAAVRALIDGMVAARRSRASLCGQQYGFRKSKNRNAMVMSSRGEHRGGAARPCKSIGQ
jgi:hypothetical protein